MNDLVTFTQFCENTKEMRNKSTANVVLNSLLIIICEHKVKIDFHVAPDEKVKAQIQLHAKIVISFSLKTMKM